MAIHTLICTSICILIYISVDGRPQSSQIRNFHALETIGELATIEDQLEFASQIVYEELIDLLSGARSVPIVLIEQSGQEAMQALMKTVRIWIVMQNAPVKRRTARAVPQLTNA